jgi:hypothetical protein
VAEQGYSVAAVAGHIIAQCRREIEAAMLQIEAARAILVSSRWLHARWEERRLADAISGGIRLPVYDARRASGFIEVEQSREARRRRRRRRAG